MSYFKFLLSVLFVYFLISCHPKELSQEETGIPELFNTDTIPKNRIDTALTRFLNSKYPICIGSFPPGSKVDINTAVLSNHILDSLKTPRRDIELNPNREQNTQNIFQITVLDSLELFYRRTKEFEAELYFPVLVQNISQQEQYWRVTDYYGHGFQQAFNTSSNTWEPIECVQSRMCSCCLFHYKIPPNYYLILLFKKYEGTYKTQGKLWLSSGKDYYQSQPYPISIHPNQFNLDTTSYLYKSLRTDMDTIDYIIPGHIFYYAPIDRKTWFKKQILN